MKTDIENLYRLSEFKEKWEKQYKGPAHGNKVRIWVGDKEVKGIGSWKISTIPWYLRWWYWLKMRRIHRGKI